MSLVHDIAYTTPLLGAIRLGQVAERNGKRVPQKNDYFSITESYKLDGEWVKHPLNQTLNAGAQNKLQSIPVKVLYTDTDLNVTERYEAYDRDSKRLVCAGNGQTARRVENGKTSDAECAGADHCQWLAKAGKNVSCGLFGRALFKIEGQSDDMAAFILRYGSYNGVNTLRHKLTSLKARLGERLPFIPLNLVLRSKSSPISMNSVFYYADLELAGEITDLTKKANEKLQALRELDIDSALYEAEVKRLRDNGRFEIDPSETFEDREEFLGSEALGGEVVVIPDTGEKAAAGDMKSSIVVRPMRGARLPRRATTLHTVASEPTVQPSPGAAVPKPSVAQPEPDSFVVI
jgi:hypothetical protein